MTHRRTAAEMLALVADAGSFQAWDGDVVSGDPLGFSDTMPYGERLRLFRERSGENEAVVTGGATIDDRRVALIVGEFGFLAGTLGVASAERVMRAFERATEQGMPVVALPVSGGTRMQEGTAAFIQMASCAAAAQRFRDAGGLYVSYLRHPTTGGVLASWASLAHVRLAEPGALIGLTGPRVIAELRGEPFPPGVQVAEHLHAHGVVDAVVAPEQLRDTLCELLGSLDPRAARWQPHSEPRTLPAEHEVAAWAAVEISRQPDRFDVRDVLDACDAQLLRLRGDGAGGDDGNCLVGIGSVCGTPAVVLAQHRDRRAGVRGASLGAVGYRQYRRGIELAGELGVPLVAFVDTVGAAMTPRDEEGGLAAMIAGCLAALAATSAPTVSVLLGEGAGGGAIALLPADRVIAAEHAWLSPIVPEGASAILYRTPDRAADVAAAQHIAATDLRRLGIVDDVVADTDAEAPARIAAVVRRALDELVAQPGEQRLAARRQRYRHAAR